MPPHAYVWGGGAKGPFLACTHPAWPASQAPGTHACSRPQADTSRPPLAYNTQTNEWELYKRIKTLCGGLVVVGWWMGSQHGLGKPLRAF